MLSGGRWLCFSASSFECCLVPSSFSDLVDILILLLEILLTPIGFRRFPVTHFGL